VTDSRFIRLLAGATLAASLSGCVVESAVRVPEPVAAVRITVAPPPLPVYEQPPCPVEGYLWTPGYWHYGPAGYFWVPGTWVQPPRFGVLWTPGYWGFVGGAYVFHEGYWGPTVGYYGGINYGGGYVGVGYAGGRWVNNQFHYNAAVSNVNVTSVHNVYRETVVNNVTIVNNTTINNTRVSYAGGPGGTRAVPSQAELAAERAPHVQPTPMQQQHRDDAAANPALFAAHNQGHPPIAATPRPSAFTAPQATAAHGAPAAMAPAAGYGEDRPHGGPPGAMAPAAGQHGDDRPHGGPPGTMHPAPAEEAARAPGQAQAAPAHAPGVTHEYHREAAAPQGGQPPKGQPKAQEKPEKEKKKEQDKDKESERH